MTDEEKVVVRGLSKKEMICTCADEDKAEASVMLRRVLALSESFHPYPEDKDPYENGGEVLTRLLWMIGVELDPIPKLTFMADMWIGIISEAEGQEPLRIEADEWHCALAWTYEQWWLRQQAKAEKPEESKDAGP